MLTKEQFHEKIAQGLCLLDGATGSNLMKAGMPTGVCPEKWILDNPSHIIKLQREYIKAGTNILLAPTFTANRIKLAEYGLEESGLDKLIKASYSLLGLISYLTAGKQETRAWTITKGTKAPQAAGKIHTDFERGFIRAEVVNYQDLLDCGSYSGAKDKGLVGLEGKEYVVKDGDVILFRFNV